MSIVIHFLSSHYDKFNQTFTDNKYSISSIKYIIKNMVFVLPYFKCK